MYRILLVCAALSMCAGCERLAKQSSPPSLTPRIAFLEKSALAGDAEAQYQLGLTYLGSGRQWKVVTCGLESQGKKAQTEVEEIPSELKDDRQAAFWLEKAAQQGRVDAQYELGKLLMPNPFDQFIDPDEVKTESKSNTDANPSAPSRVAENDKDDSKSVAKDGKRALHWLMLAAKQGHSGAQFELGSAYAAGTVIAKDEAAKIEWWKRAAEQGNRDAQHGLGYSYQTGAGVTKDERTAVDWYTKAAEQGDSYSQLYLADAYDSARGVAKDEVAAFGWYRRRAEAGCDLAQLQVGWRYYTGTGAPKDFQKAKEWWRKAADAGNAEGMRRLALLYREGEGVPKDAAIALDLFRNAAARGDSVAQRFLGAMLFNGEGTTKDVVLGYAWTNIVAASGDETALKNRTLMERQMEAHDVSEAQRLSSSWKQGAPLDREGSVAVPARGAQASVGSMKKTGSGTIFLVSQDGQGITNHHVINGCKEVRLQGSAGAATVVTSDTVNDLALVRVPESDSASAPLIADPGKLRQGEDIVVFGFPLNSVLSSGGNLTPGVVSALSGLGNNTNQLQITAAIQPGSSGSPVVNKRGEVVAVVSQKLSDGAMVKATGQVGQNVNFAVNGQTLRAFLDANHVKYKSGTGFFAGEKSTADLADNARQWTRVVECWK